MDLQEGDNRLLRIHILFYSQEDPFQPRWKSYKFGGWYDNYIFLREANSVTSD